MYLVVMGSLLILEVSIPVSPHRHWSSPGVAAIGEIEFVLVLLRVLQRTAPRLADVLVGTKAHANKEALLNMWN